MKTFKQQMRAVLKERDNEVDPKKLADVTTPAAQTLMLYIQQWNFRSRNIALGRLLECDRWQKDGTLALECDHKGKPYPAKLPLEFAYERYMYGDQRAQYYPSYSFARGVKNIPDNLTDDWAGELKEMFFDIQRMTLKDFKLVCLGKWVKSLSGTNPHAIAGWEREVGEFKDAQAAINAYVKDREGWKHLNSEHLQRPESKKELSKVLDDILAAADAVVEPAFKALAEQHRRDNIRRDATMARNDVKGIRGFFQKYATPEPNALKLVEGIIGDVESQTLNNPKEPKS